MQIRAVTSAVFKHQWIVIMVIENLKCMNLNRDVLYVRYILHFTKITLL